MTDKEFDKYLKEHYPHINEIDDDIIDEIHNYVDEYCGYGGDESEEFDKGFSQAVEMCLSLIDHFSKDCVRKDDQE